MTKHDSSPANSAETSSLFSLSSLQEMAETQVSKPAPTDTYADGSGLLDIRAIAESSRATGHGAEPPAPLAQPSTALPSLLTPLPQVVATHAEGPSRGMKVAMAVMGVAIVGLGVTTGYLILHPRSGAQLSAEQGTEVAAVAAVEAPGEASHRLDSAPSGAVMAEQPKQEEAAEGKPAATTDRRAPAPTPASETRSVAAKAPAPSPAPAEKPAARGDASINDLLDQALGGSSSARKSSASAPKASASGPATPSRDDVLAAMQKVTPQVQRCANGAGGVATAKIKFAGATGRVVDASVDSVSDAKARACIVRAVSQAKLPTFTSPSFSVTYPFKL